MYLFIDDFDKNDRKINSQQLNTSHTRDRNLACPLGQASKETGKDPIRRRKADQTVQWRQKRDYDRSRRHVSQNVHAEQCVYINRLPMTIFASEYRAIASQSRVIRKLMPWKWPQSESPDFRRVLCSMTKIECKLLPRSIAQHWCPLWHTSNTWVIEWVAKTNMDYQLVQRKRTQ